MKVTKHGNTYSKTPPIKVECECGCHMEVDESELEGNSNKWIFCVECREMVMVPEEAIQAAHDAVIAKR